MQATISKWGNSLALRLPKHLADQVRLVEGATVELEIMDGSLKITPARKRFKLADLLEGEKRKADDEASAEFDWGKPKGDEAW